MTSCLASLSFEVASTGFIEEIVKNLEFIKGILLRLLGFGDITIPFVIENQTLVLFWNETSSGVMNVKDSFLSSNKHSHQRGSHLRADAQQH